jgi:hypothetical protein
MSEIKTLQARVKELEADKRIIESEISVINEEIEAIRLAAYPHKVGDVIPGRSNRLVKIVRIVAGVDDVFPVVVEKLPSGGWSKRERFQINWDLHYDDDK